MKKRKGIALIWVVLMSALILVSIVGVTIRAVPEKKILNSRSHTERALAVAETGLAELINDARTKKDEVEKSLREQGKYEINQEDFDEGAGNPSVKASYTAKIVQESSDKFGFYSLGEVKDKRTGEVLARKVIKVTYTGNLPPLDEYALFTAGSINAQNGTVNGNIFSNSSIYFKNATLNGYAYCHTADITGIPDNQKVPNQTQLGFPPLDLNKYKALWTAFINGLSPFNGSNPDYPNTSGINIKTYLLKKFPNSIDGSPATQSQFESFFSDIKNASDPNAAYLRGFLEKLVYYVKPDKNKDTVTISGSLFQNSPPVLEGTLIVEGNLDLVGGAYIGQYGDSWNTSILVTGTVDVGAGGATLNGLLYVMGTNKHGNEPVFSVNASGSFECNGSIVALGDIDLNSDKLDINWKENRIYMEELKKNWNENNEFTLSPDPSSWVEISYDEFPEN